MCYPSHICRAERQRNLRGSGKRHTGSSPLRTSRHLATRRGFLLSAVSAGALLHAQTDTQTDAIFTSGVKVVNTLATVQNKSGKLINDLTKDDFTLLEDSRQQKISYFAQQSDLPLALELMIDTSMSQ